MSNGEIAAETQDTPDAALAAARGALGRGDLDQALREWADLRDRFPDHPAAYQAAARALADAKDFDKAEVVLLEGWLRVRSAGPVFASEFARMAARRHDTPEGIRRWKAVRAAFPEHPIGWVGGVEMLREAGMVDEAAELLEQVKQRFPNEHAIATLAASLADVRKDWAASVGLWAVARTRLPQNPIGYIKGARALSNLGELDQADALLAEGTECFPENAELVAQWAELAARCGRWPDAAARWALLRKSQPANAAGYINGSEALLKAGSLAEAEALMAETIQRFPSRDDLQVRNARHADIQLHLARTLAAQDRLDEAEASLRQAIERYPHRHEMFAEYAALASRRHDWAEALRRWRDAQQRFPQIKNFAHRVFEAELRVVETTAPTVSEAPVSPKLEPVVLAADTPDMRNIMLRFESLGGTLHGCEFGLVQRDFGVEPLGLLRWTEMGPDNLIAALEAEFEGVGLPENTELGVHHTQDGPEYFTRDKRFMMSMHTFIKETEISHSKMFGQCCRRLQFLRDKLISDLQTGAKIFVYKITWRLLTKEELARLHAAVRRYGDATLLYVQREIPGKPHGTVEMVKPGLMMGYIDRFSASETGDNLGPATAAWGLVCRNALAALSVSQEASGSSTDRSERMQVPEPLEQTL
jgi:tetratricopeptide (TPR) repeat protein